MIKLGTKKTISIKIIKYFGNYLSKIVHLVYGYLQKRSRFPCFPGNGICIDFLICQGYARSRAQGGCYRRKYRDGEVDDFLPKFFLAHGFNGCLVDTFFEGTDYTDFHCFVFP